MNEWIGTDGRVLLWHEFDCTFLVPGIAIVCLTETCVPVYIYQHFSSLTLQPQ